MEDIRKKGEEMIEQARKEGRRIIVLVGRPYHVDPEINHGIDKLIAGFGAAVVTEDSLSWHMHKQAQGVLNQWTYHARLYAAARYITTQKDMNLVQLVSFGCGDGRHYDRRGARDSGIQGQDLYPRLRLTKSPIWALYAFACVRCSRRSTSSRHSLLTTKGRIEPMPSNHVEFTREMREAGYTILVPNMLEFHFP